MWKIDAKCNLFNLISVVDSGRSVVANCQRVFGEALTDQVGGGLGGGREEEEGEDEEEGHLADARQTPDSREKGKLGVSSEAT